MRVFMPEHLDARTMYVVLGQVFDENGLFRTNEFIFDFKSTHTVDEVGIVMFDTMALRLAASQCKGKLEAGEALAKNTRSLLKKLLDAGNGERLSELLFLEDAIKRPHVEGELHRIAIVDADYWMVRVFNNWLARVLYTSSLVVAPQTLRFVELLYNVQQHAGVSMASIAIAHDPVREEVRFILSDAGTGIPASVRQNIDKPFGDDVCIAQALEGKFRVETPGSNSDEGHGGQPIRSGGLGRLVAEIVDRRTGIMMISSACGKVRIMPGRKGRIYVFEPAHAWYPGTLIEICFSTHAFQPAYMFNEPSTESRFFEINEY